MPNAGMDRRSGVPRNDFATSSPHGGSVARFVGVAGTLLAMLITLLLLLAARPITECFVRGWWLLQRSPLGPTITRKPFAVSLAASVGGTTVSLLVDTGVLPLLVGAPLVVLACVALAAAAPVSLAAAASPSIHENSGVSMRLRRFHARAGHSELDAGWSEVVLGASLLIAPPFLVAVTLGEAAPLALVIYATAIWATHPSLVDFEHGDAHYGFFKPCRAAAAGDRRLLAALRWFAHQPLALMSTRIPNWYAVQHVAVHHAENNGLADTQSTAPYDRASFAGFAACAQRFALSGLVPLDVLKYLSVRRRSKALGRLYRGYGVYVAWIAVLLVLNPTIAFLMIGLRYASLVADAASFFQEHGLIAPDRPEAIITNALHYINPDTTHGSRGEDLHIEHHLRPGLHWSHYTAQQASRQGEYERHQAIGFYDGPGQLKRYYRLLWRRDFVGLARHVHVFGGQGMQVHEVARLLETRTAPAGPRPKPSAPRWLEGIVGPLAATII